MNKGFVKLHRRILEHDWLNDRPEYRVAWEDILLTADYKTARVTISSIPSRRYFSKAAWSRFVQRLLDDGMITDVQTENHGRRAGIVTSATIVRYREYHDTEGGGTAPEPQGNRKRNRLRSSDASETSDDEPVSGTAAEPQRNRLNNKEVKEDKEDQEDLSFSQAVDQELREKQSPEAQFFRQMQYGGSVHDPVKAAALFRELLGPSSTDRQVQGNELRWYRQFGEAEIRRVWFAAFEQSDKKPLYWFVDELNGLHRRRKTDKRREKPATSTTFSQAEELGI